MKLKTEGNERFNWINILICVCWYAESTPHDRWTGTGHWCHL